MTLRLQNMMLAMLLALTTLFVGLGTVGQNPASGGYQLFERAVSGISADNTLTALENFAPPPESASECCIATNNVPNIVIDTKIQTQMSNRGWSRQNIDDVIADGPGATVKSGVWAILMRRPDFGLMA